MNQRTNRAKILEPIADCLGISFKKFKNKQLLITEIERVKGMPRSARCYNKTDPCTMESLDTIDDLYFVEWNQFNRHFGADARSLKQMMDTKNNMLPWSIDFSSGVQASIDHEIYIQSFDMRLVKGLVDLILSKTLRLDQPVVALEEIVSFDNYFLFQMDSLLGGSGYAYGTILNTLINNPNVFTIYETISEKMFLLFHVVKQSGMDSLNTDIYYQYCYLCYTIKGFHIKDKQEHLMFMLEIFTQFSTVIGTELSVNILQLLFIDM